MQTNFLIDEAGNPEIEAIIRKGVLEYDEQYLGKWDVKPFSLYEKNSQDHIIGGISGDYVSHYVRVKWAWIHHDYRRKGLGRQLFQALDEFARHKSCRYIQLETSDYEARPFYEKLGFS